MPVKFVDHTAKSELKNKRLLSSFLITQISQQVHKKSNLTYIFVSEQELLQMNQTYLQHDTHTDIITFDLSEKPTEIIGEIYISIAMVTANAIKFSTGYNAELLRVICHGALHLCGFGDKTKAQKIRMRAAEDAWMLAYQQS